MRYLVPALVVCGSQLAFTVCYNSHAKRQPNAEYSSTVESAAPLTLTEKDAGRSVSVPRSSLIKIKLLAQLSTGYSWQLEEFDKEHRQIVEVTAPTIETAVQEDRVGKVETQVFSVRCKGDGEIVLKFLYVRPWEKEKPAKRFSVTVKVISAPQV